MLSKWVLGATWGPTEIQPQLEIDFFIDFSSILGPRRTSKIIQTCFFRYSKANQNSSRFSIALSTDLVSIFDGFGDVFLMIAEVWLFIWLKRQMFRIPPFLQWILNVFFRRRASKSTENHHANDVESWRYLEHHFGHNFGSILAPFWTPFWSKNHQKSILEGIEKQLRTTMLKKAIKTSL